MSKKPILIKAGDPRVTLGYLSQPPAVDIRVVHEDEYQRMISLISDAGKLINLNEDTPPVRKWTEEYRNWMNG